MIEALVNDTVSLTMQEWQLLVADRLTSNISKIGRGKCLANVPNLLDRSMAALREESRMTSANCELHYDVEALKKSCTVNIQTQRGSLKQFNESRLTSELRHQIHACHHRNLALALATGIILNCIEVALNGDKAETRLVSSRWLQEINNVSELALDYRPLGSTAMMIALSVAWIGATEASNKEKSIVFAEIL